ncbi:MAG: tetratricopeptide repeat protein, partial [Fibrobacteraceae bacterium]
MNKVVSKCVKKKLGVVVLFFASIGCIMSCNLFNPTNSSNIDSDDADGLLYEGQMLFRNGEYTKAAEYFNKAIKADSTKSQAWFGLAKANMYSSDVTAFDMYNDLQVEDNEIPFMGMSTFDIERYHAGISITMAPLRELVRRDT